MYYYVYISETTEFDYIGPEIPDAIGNLKEKNAKVAMGHLLNSPRDRERK